jgi:hypothetical protein
MAGNKATQTAEEKHMADTNEWYTVAEAAEMTGRHPRMIHYWVAQGRLPENEHAVGEAWPHPVLLSAYAIVRIARQPRRDRRKNPLAKVPRQQEAIPQKTVALPKDAKGAPA